MKNGLVVTLKRAYYDFWNVIWYAIWVIVLAGTIPIWFYVLMDGSFGTKKDAVTHFARGGAYSERGYGARAIAEYGRAIRLDSNFAAAYKARGIKYHSLLDSSCIAAIADYSRAIQFDSNDAAIYYRRGIVYSGKGEKDSAFADFNRAVWLDSSYADAYYDREIMYYSQAIQPKSNNTETCYNGKGDIFYRIFLSWSIPIYGWLELDVFTVFWLLWSVTYFMIVFGESKETRRNRRETEAMRREMKPYLEKQLALLKGGTGETSENAGSVPEREMDAEFLRLCLKLCKSELKADFADAYGDRGTEYLNKDDYDKAIEGFNNVIRLYPDFADVYVYRGTAYSEKGDYDRAIEDFSNAIRLDPNYSAAYYYRGITYCNKGDFDKAIENYDNMIQLTPDDADAYNNRGCAYGEKENLDKAIADFDKAIHLEPDYAAAYHNRGEAYHKKGDLAKAVADYEEAVRLDPEDEEAKKALLELAEKKS